MLGQGNMGNWAHRPSWQNRLPHTLYVLYACRVFTSGHDFWHHNEGRSQWKVKFGACLVSDEPELVWGYSLVPALLCKKSGNKQQEVPGVPRDCFPSFLTVSLLQCTLIFPQWFPKGCIPYGHHFNRPGFHFPSAWPCAQAIDQCPWIYKTQT